MQLNAESVRVSNNAFTGIKLQDDTGGFAGIHYMALRKRSTGLKLLASPSVFAAS